MKSSQAKAGRVFVVRLEDGEILHEVIEEFAEKQKIRAAGLIVLGGVDAGSKLVVGPEEGRGRPVVPMELVLGECTRRRGWGRSSRTWRGSLCCICTWRAVGRGRRGRGACGAGCGRGTCWRWWCGRLVGTTGRRVADAATGFELLEPSLAGLWRRARTVISSRGGGRHGRRRRRG